MNRKILLIFKDPRLNPDDDIEPIGTVSNHGSVGCNDNGEVELSYFRYNVVPNKNFCLKQKFNTATNAWSIDKNSLKRVIKEAARKCIHDKGLIMNIDLYMFINNDAIVAKTYDSRKSKTHTAVIDGEYEKEWKDHVHTYYPLHAVFRLVSVDKIIPLQSLHTIFDQMVKDDIIDSYIISE